MSNNPPLPEPDNYETVLISTGESAQVSNEKNTRPRRARRLLDTEDWRIIAIIALVALVCAMLGGFAGTYIAQHI